MALALASLTAVSAFAEKHVVSPRGIATAAPGFPAALATDEVVYISGLDGRDRAGRFRLGDIRAQTRQTIENLRATLAAEGMTLGHVAHVHLYLADIRQLAAADEVYARFFPTEPPARTVLEGLLPSPEARVALGAVAVRDRESRRAILLHDLASSRAPASDAVLAGARLYLSLSPPAERNGGGLALEIEAQTERALERQNAVLAAAGLGFADLVFSRIYLAAPSDYAGLNRVYERFVTAVPPARATVLARTADPRRLVGIQSVAVAGSGRDRPRGEGHTSPIHSYSVRAGNHLYVTGMTGRRRDGGYTRGDIRAQTRQSLETIREQLARHGFEFADVVDSTVWLRDMCDFAGWSEAYREVFGTVPHAGAVVEIPPVSDEGLVEIMVTAAR